ncbi:MAG: enoyl-CoA hydratase/isomerase family protein [Acidimicrobiia bacterium]|jgi:enoyl-CoA hydratase/carnithine racemase
MSDHLLIEDRGPARWLRFNRPAKRNAVTRAMAETLRTELARAADDATIVTLVLTGTGDTFCAGVDVKEALQGPDAALRQERSTPLWPVDELVNFPKPFLCCLNGAAVGGGATLAMTTDLRLAAESASLTFSLGRLGLTPEVGSSFLLWRQVGYGVALDLMLTGRTVPAPEALALRLVHRVVPDGDAESATQTLAEGLAELPHDAAARTKQVLRAGLEASYADARKNELRELAEFGRRTSEEQ